MAVEEMEDKQLKSELKKLEKMRSVQLSFKPSPFGTSSLQLIQKSMNEIESEIQKRENKILW